MKLAIFFFFFSLQCMSCGPKLWGKKSQNTSFFTKYKRLVFPAFVQPYKLHLEHSVLVIWIHRTLSWELTRYTATFSTWRLTKPGWGRNARLSITENATACSKLFLFLDHTESEEAMMTEKEVISRNLNDFKADDLHVKHSITSVIGKQVLERTRDKWSSTKTHYLQVSKGGMLQWRKSFFHMCSRECRYSRLNIR